MKSKEELYEEYIKKLNEIENEFEKETCQTLDEYKTKKDALIAELDAKFCAAMSPFEEQRSKKRAKAVSEYHSAIGELP